MSCCLIQSKTEIKINHDVIGLISFCYDDDFNMLIVDELRHEVFLLNQKTGQPIWKTNQFKYPSDCCFDGSNFWVTDRYNHRVISLNKNGDLQKIIGTYGDLSQTLKEPFGINFLKEKNQIIVADSGNNKLKIFSFNGVFIKEIGILGPGVEYYESDFFKKQTVFKKWVTAQSIYNTIESAFFESRFLLGDLEKPKGVCVFNDIIAVADFSGKLQFFDQDGLLLKSYYNYKYLQWVFSYNDEIFFSSELSSKLFKINKDFEVIEFIDLQIELGKFYINDNFITFLSPWENKIYRVEFKII